MNWLKGIIIFCLGIFIGTSVFGIIVLNHNQVEVSTNKIEDENPTLSGENINSSITENSLNYPVSLNTKVPVLMYHHIKINTQPNNTTEAGLDVNPQMFERQLEILSRQGYTAITMAQLQSDLVSGNVTTRRVALTFDDGYDDIYDTALPIMKKYNMVGTIYLVVDNIGKPRYMTVGQIADMKNAGWEIGSHTLSHPNLATAGEASLKREVGKSKMDLEEMFGVVIYSFCYPSGKYNDRVVKAVKEAGYENATTTNEGYADAKTDLFIINRLQVNGRGKLSDFAAKIFIE